MRKGGRESDYRRAFTMPLRVALTPQCPDSLALGHQHHRRRRHHCRHCYHTDAADADDNNYTGKDVTQDTADEGANEALGATVLATVPSKVLFFFFTYIFFYLTPSLS